jgi:hypothetical protein
LVFDFGEVWTGTTVKHEFTFRNTGSETLYIQKPKPRCVCSVAEGYSKEVPPGETGIMPFVLKTKNKPHGPANEWLTIDTNDPTRPVMKMTLKGLIRDVCRPEVVYDALHEWNKASGKATRPIKKLKASFGKIKSDDRLYRVIKLRNTSGRPLELALIPPPANARFQVELKETNPGEEFELTVSGEPPWPQGRWSMPIQFRTNVPEKRVYGFGASARVPPRVEVVPEKIVLNQKLNPTKMRRIKIINNGTTPVEVISIATSHPQYDVKLLPRDPSEPKEEVIEIRFPGGTAYEPPPYGELIEIRTNDPERELIQIYVLPRSKAPREPRPPEKPLELHPVPIPS